MSYISDFREEGLPNETLDIFVRRKNYPLAPRDCAFCMYALQIDGDPSIARCSDPRYDGKKCPLD